MVVYLIKCENLNDIGSNSLNHKTHRIFYQYNITFYFYNIFFNYNSLFSNAFKTYFLNEKTILF